MREDRAAKKGLGGFKTLLPYLKPHVPKIIGGAIAVILIDYLQIILPRMIRAAIDLISATGEAAGEAMQALLPKSIYQALAPAIDSIVTDSGTIRLILWIVVAAIIAGIFISIGRFLWRRWLAGSAIRITADLRRGLLAHLQTLSYSFYDTQQVGDLMAHATNDLNAVMRAMMPGFVIIVDIFFMGVLTIVYMTTLRWPLTGLLTLYSTIPLIVMSFLIGWFGKLLHTRFRAVRDAFSSMTARVTENLTGIRVVKAYVQETGETESFRNTSQDYVKKNISLVKIWGLFFPFIMLLSNLSLFLILLLGGRMVILTQLTVGDFVAFQAYLWMLIWPMMAIGWVINLLQSGSASIGRINDLLDTKPEITDTSDVVELTETSPSNTRRPITLRLQT
jgi:ATP-binding cassette subfamily B multidrug efflux pump